LPIILVLDGRATTIRGEVGGAFRLTNDIIVYRVVGADARIMRVVHGRRDLLALFGR
jgi:plasmid stabilization system protein ParE